MRNLLRYSAIALVATSVFAQGAGKKVLFDHMKHEDAGTSAQWVICSGHEPDPSPANPSSETDWNGGYSAWGVDLYKAGFKVQTLPATGKITYGDATNAQDLSNYNAYIIPECYVLFTAAEKQAILAFVRNGGGLFLVGNHFGSNRYSGGTDAVHVFNDLMTENGTNVFGFTYVTGHGAGDAKANITSSLFSTASNAATQAILHGPFGGVSLMDFHAYSYLTVDTSKNPNAQEILKTSVSGDTGSLIAFTTLGSGRVVAITDSAPADDGTTTTSGKSLQNSYSLNNNRSFWLNATTWLAGTSSAPVPTVSITAPASNVTVAPGASVSFQATASISDNSTLSYAWAFGDGGTSASLGPVSHAYSTAGTYTATFTATSAQSQSASATRVITVKSAANTVSASITAPASDTTVASGSALSFAGTATDSDSTATLSYAWNFGDGTTATGATASHTFTNTGTAAVARTVTFTATDGTGATASATRTITVSPASTPATTQLLTNPGFESGTTGWSGTTSVIGTFSTEPAHAGTKCAFLCGKGKTTSQTLYQQVAIPSTASKATLNFYLHINTAETGTKAYDTLKVQVRNSSGTVLSTLGTFSNVNAASGYALKTYDLSAYKGQTIQVYLAASEDSTLQTSFVVDDFSLNVQ